MLFGILVIKDEEFTYKVGFEDKPEGSKEENYGFLKRKSSRKREY